jgi:uncharacterized UPF0160 family protein
MTQNRKLKLITHDGSFHTDDIFSAAALSIYLEQKGEAFEIIRTRDPEVVGSGDYVFDVGGVYDEGKNRFDHHQIGGAGKRPGEGEVEYASFGLVWRKFGVEICGDERAAQILDQKLVLPIDAWDNGYDLVTNKYSGVSPYFLQHIFGSMEPTWAEGDKDMDSVFPKCVALAREILTREIINARDALLAEENVVRAYKNAKDKRIIILGKNYPYEYVLKNFPEPLFVVYPRSTNNYWGVKAIRQDPKTFNSRRDLPASWAGLRAEELAKVSGVSDAVFCHKGLFMAVAKTKEGAIKLAELALGS